MNFPMIVFRFRTAEHFQRNAYCYAILLSGLIDYRILQNNLRFVQTELTSLRLNRERTFSVPGSNHQCINLKYEACKKKTSWK